MIPGTLVRFKKHIHDIKWLIGMLVDWNSNSKEAVIMYSDEILNIPLDRVQRYGRRYLEASKTG